MPGLALVSRTLKHYTKTITFDGTANNGAITPDETVAVASVTGRVLITHLSAFCSTTIVTTTNGEIELGVAGNLAGLIAQIADAGDLVATEFWNDSTPTGVYVDAAVVDKTVGSDIILTVTTSPMTAGVIEFSILWLPMSLDGKLG